MTVITAPLGAVVPLRAAPGYLGITAKTIEVDWATAEKYGPPIMVASRSPAWKAGLRSGDFVTEIGGKSFAAFHASVPPGGTEFAIVAYRKGFGVIRTFGTLGPAPVSKPLPKWKSTPAVLAGRHVEKKERPRFLQREVAGNPNLTDRDLRMLSLLIERDGERGIFIRHVVLAQSAGCGITAVKESLSRCQHFGYLRIISGKTSHKSNVYEVTWPASRTPSPADGNAPTANPEAARLTERILGNLGFASDDRRSRNATVIVVGWLARGWNASTIEMVVATVMKHQRPVFSSLAYFTPAIAKAYQGGPR